MLPPLWQRDTREVVAIKCVSKRSLNQASVENLLTEIEILKTIRHPHIVELKDFEVGLGASQRGHQASSHLAQVLGSILAPQGCIHGARCQQPGKPVQADPAWMGYAVGLAVVV